MDGISVIICCYNAEKRISDTLKYLSNQKCYVNVEIILVDNNSVDETVNVAKSSWNNDIIKLTILNVEKQGKTYAFEEGYKIAQHDIILICDDDNWLFDNYLQLGFEILNNDESIGALGGRGISVFESNPPNWFSQLIGEGYAAGSQGKDSGDITSKGWLYGAGMLIRKRVYDNIKSNGFKNYLSGHIGNVLLSGEDAELCFAIALTGSKIWYDDRLIFYHYTEKHKLTWEYALKIYEGYGAANIVLTCYKLALTKNLQLFNKHLWWHEIFRLIKKNILSISLLYYLLFKKRMNGKTLEAAKNYGEIKYLLLYKQIFKENHNTVIRLCKKYNFFCI